MLVTFFLHKDWPICLWKALWTLWWKLKNLKQVKTAWWNKAFSYVTNNHSLSYCFFIKIKHWEKKSTNNMRYKQCHFLILGWINIQTLTWDPRQESYLFPVLIEMNLYNTSSYLCEILVFFSLHYNDKHLNFWNNMMVSKIRLSFN